MLPITRFLEDNSSYLKYLISLELLEIKNDVEQSNHDLYHLLCDGYKTMIESFESILPIPYTGLQLLVWGSMKYKLANFTMLRGDKNEASKVLQDVLKHCELSIDSNALINRLCNIEISDLKLSDEAVFLFNTVAGLLQLMFNLFGACSYDSGKSGQKSSADWLLSATRVYELYTSYNRLNCGPEFLETLLYRFVFPHSTSKYLHRLSNILFQYGYATSVFMLAQFYQISENPCKSANYCHLTLVKQLQCSTYFKELITASYEDTKPLRRSISPTSFTDPKNVCALKYGSYDLVYYPCSIIQLVDNIEWALNAASLANYYSSQEDSSSFYRKTLECLLTALLILEQNQLQNRIISKSNPKHQATKFKRIKNARADIYRGLSQYGLTLLERGLYLKDKKVSNVSISSDVDDESDSINNFGSMFNQNLEPILQKLVNQKSSSDNKKSGSLTNSQTHLVKILVLPPKDYSQAFLIFQIVLQCLSHAEQWYTLQDRCSDAIGLIQSRSKAYKLLAKFESDINKQCCMHKKRTDLLESVLEQLNPQHYLLLCRQLRFELAEAITTLKDLKQKIYDQIPLNDTQSKVHYARKINLLTKRAIGAFEQFLDDFWKPNRSGEKNINENDIRPVLASHFYIARLHSNFIVVTIPEKIRNLSQALSHYKQVVQLSESYLRHNPASPVSQFEELPLAKEMVELLPYKIDRLYRGENLN